MVPTNEMLEPATKADLKELREELREDMKPLATKVEQLREEWKSDLEIWAGAVRAELSDNVRALRAEIANNHRVVLGELASLTRAVEESTRAHFVALDDKYRDIPRG